MSRIGKLPVPVPAGVDVTIEGQTVTATGPKGTLSHTVATPIEVARNEEGAIEVSRPNEERKSKELHGLSRTMVANIVTGVSQGYQKKMEIVGVGYRAVPQGPTTLELSLGYSHPITVDAPDGVTFEVETPTKFTVSGIDKQVVNEVAANIRKLRKPEPYKGKGVKYADEQIRRKIGKAGK